MDDMNNVMIEVPSDVSEVSDLCGVSLSELPAGPATEAIVARVAYEKTPAFAVGAFNSYI
jgi:hypothetical protein